MLLLTFVLKGFARFVFLSTFKQTFTCSKSVMEVLKKVRNTKKTTERSHLYHSVVFILNFGHISHHLFDSAFIADFELANVSWVLDFW